MGYGNLDIIERVQLNFLKYILKIKSSTPNYMVDGGTGIALIALDIDERMIVYWTRLCNGNTGNTNNNNNNHVNKLSSVIYKCMLNKTHKLPENTLKTRYHWFFAIKTVLIKFELINRHLGKSTVRKS